MFLLFDLSKFQSSENTKKRIKYFRISFPPCCDIRDSYPFPTNQRRQVPKFLPRPHALISFDIFISHLVFCPQGHLPLSYFRSPFPSSSLLAPGQNFQNASPLLDFLPAAAAAVNLVGRRNAAFPPALTRRPRSLKGLQAVDGLLSGAKAAQVGKDATETLCIVVHVRDECGRGRRFESFGAEPVGEGGHAAGPVGIWFRGCDLWQAGASVVTRVKVWERSSRDSAKIKGMERERMRYIGARRHTSAGFGTKGDSGVVGSSLVSSMVGGFSPTFSVSSSGVMLLSNSSKVSLELMSNLGRLDFSDCSNPNFGERTGVVLGWTVPVGSLDADGREKFRGRGICPLGRDRGLLGVAVFVGA